jgi:hypothetical protein
MELIGTLGALLSRERGWELGPSQGGLLKNLHKIKIGIKILLIPIQCGVMQLTAKRTAIERQIGTTSWLKQANPSAKKIAI